MAPAVTLSRLEKKPPLVVVPRVFASEVWRPKRIRREEERREEKKRNSVSDREFGFGVRLDVAFLPAGEGEEKFAAEVNRYPA